MTGPVLAPVKSDTRINDIIDNHTDVIVVFCAIFLIKLVLLNFIGPVGVTANDYLRKWYVLIVHHLTLRDLLES